MSSVTPWFEDSFLGFGGLSLECGFCGRMYFDNSQDTEIQWDWEDGELDRMRRWAQEKPDECVALDGCVSGALFDGVLYVWGCPCDGAKKWEDFLWDQRSQIVKYLEERTKAEAPGYWRERVLRSLMVAEAMMAEPKGV